MHKWQMRVVIAVIFVCIAVIALGYFVPDRFALLGLAASGLLFVATVWLGLMQLAHSKRRPPQLRARAINFIEEWSAGEELCVAPSGETEAEVRQRFRAEAEAAGLTEKEIAIGLADSDMPAIIAKHGSKS